MTCPHHDTPFDPYIATMTELREPHMVIARANGKPVAILKNSAVIAYFIPIEFIENGGNPFQTMEEVIDALRPDDGIAS